MNDTILTVQGLSKKFTVHILDKKTLHGCDNVSFAMKPGEFMGIAGPSGSGKSTIIKCLYRTYLPSGGSVWYRTKDGREIDLVTAGEREILELRHSEISYVSQFLKVIPRVSAVQILAEELRERGWNAEAAQERSYELLRMMNIDAELWDAYPSTFSGGEQQRINLARALITEPRLLLLDEPTASLDNETKKVVIRSLLALKQKGTTIIGIFHDLESMRSLVDKVFTMRAGQCKSIKRMREVV
ncbi:Alpha-D-ribose 1-methylphosphonate 5-triphosphate synthase subunit PhnL [Sporomusa silvacetica DSM 10669]|uniref:Alpha-D-ribose 1-methylphosphonate 5-triphosphate synthase subunit PhnL n=1 Tax=Sporomusa silvacetica DSM 10669 TaxID=1123289 RepID=A0ABZ3IRU6_9FIRM|nr:phosphonate C-P lyase system protein PhnL [Sporomusa silvacetica]OZC20840.1 alpha-D-ribose 1-methylphosphonate 5-triphosphate synthase subunit PhnL [Sporomusa silvacetica DSM 10669]